MKKAIVTGGTGVVGKWLIKELTRKGIEVIVLARKCPQKEEQVNGCIPCGQEASGEGWLRNWRLLS